jgi:hypothetical protein
MPKSYTRMGRSSLRPLKLATMSVYLIPVQWLPSLPQRISMVCHSNRLCFRTFDTWLCHFLRWMLLFSHFSLHFSPTWRESIILSGNHVNMNLMGVGFWLEVLCMYYKGRQKNNLLYVHYYICIHTFILVEVAIVYHLFLWRNNIFVWHPHKVGVGESSFMC